jgi:hypothetical protein
MTGPLEQPVEHIEEVRGFGEASREGRRGEEGGEVGRPEIDGEMACLGIAD